MKRYPFFVLAVVALCIPRFAFGGQLEIPAVNSANNPTPLLVPGGPGITVSLNGANLDRISSVKILQGGLPVGDVTASLAAGSPTTRAVTFKALASAAARTGLVIRISDGRQSIDIPAKIIEIAVGPARPVNTLGPANTSPRPIDTTKSTTSGPVVTSVAINNGAASTVSTHVTLNMSVQGAGYYRASESSVFTGANWQVWTITAVPSFDLSPGNGMKTVYVQVKNAAGTISPTASDTIALSVPPAPSRQEYVIGGGEAYIFSQTQGFKFSTKLEDPVTQEGYIKGDGGLLNLSTSGKPMNIFGSRCDYVLFDGRELTEGWVFKSYNASPVALITTRTTTRVDERPEAGSRIIRFKIHLSTEAGSFVSFTIVNLTLEGPAGRDWREAFR